MSSFANAHNFVITKAEFITAPLENGREGLKALLAHSVPEATYDSSARDPPPLCHPGTRTECTDALTNWCVRRTGDHADHIKLLKGPTGVGKTAVLQSVAEILGESGHLGASFFFSRPNNRKDPMRLFTTIAYQLSVKFEALAELLNATITRDPTVLQKSLPTQFKALLTDPICKLTNEGGVLPKLVIIVDGIDECEGETYQTEIIRIVASSVQAQKTPFLWIFSSRLEHHLIQLFESIDFQHLVTKMELTISREIDSQIYKFLSDKLVEAARKYDLQDWPLDREIILLVDLSAGHFIYATVTVRFIDDGDVNDPKGQLEKILLLKKDPWSSSEAGHPLSALDNFYKVLIFERLTPKQLRNTLSILLVNHLFSQLEPSLGDLTLFHPFSSAPEIRRGQLIANILGLTEEGFRAACRSLHAVMYLDANLGLNFYHASFPDFLQDRTRSQQYCIWSHRVVLVVLGHIVNALRHVQFSTAPRGEHIPKLPVTWPRFTSSDEDLNYYREVASVFFCLLGNLHRMGTPHINEKALETEIITKLRAFEFTKAILCQDLQLQWWSTNAVRKLEDFKILHRLRLVNAVLDVLKHAYKLTGARAVKQLEIYRIGNGTGWIIFRARLMEMFSYGGDIHVGPLFLAGLESYFGFTFSPIDRGETITKYPFYDPGDIFQVLEHR